MVTDEVGRTKMKGFVLLYYINKVYYVGEKILVVMSDIPRYCVDGNLENCRSFERFLSYISSSPLKKNGIPWEVRMAVMASF